MNPAEAAAKAADTGLLVTRLRNFVQLPPVVLA